MCVILKLERGKRKFKLYHKKRKSFLLLRMPQSHKSVLVKRRENTIKKKEIQTQRERGENSSNY